MASNARPRRTVGGGELTPNVRTRSAVKASTTTAAGSLPNRKVASANPPTRKVQKNETHAPSSSPAKKSGSPLRRSGRLEMHSKSSGSSGSKSGKEAAPKKRGVDEVSGPRNGKSEENADRPAKKKKRYDARSYRSLFTPLAKENVSVLKKKVKESVRPEEVSDEKVKESAHLELDRTFHEKDNAAELDSLEETDARCKNDNLAEYNPAGTRDKVAGDTHRREHDAVDFVLSRGQLCEQESSAVDKCKNKDNENSSGSLDSTREQNFHAEASKCSKLDSHIAFKCSSNSQQSLIGDLSKLEANSGLNKAQSCSLSKIGFRSIDWADCTSEEGSFAGNTDQDGGDVSLSLKGDATKVAGSDASTKSTEIETFTQDIPSEVANFFLIRGRGRNITETADGGNDKNVTVDKLEVSPTTIETNVDNLTLTCPICKQPDTLLFCKGKNCKRGYHLTCVDPPLKEVPPGVWLCLCCVRKKLDLGIYSVSDGMEAVWDFRLVEVTQNSGVQNERQYLVKYIGLAHVHDRWISENKALSEAPDLVATFRKQCLKEKKPLWKQEWCIPQRLLQKRLIMPPELVDEYFYGDCSNGSPHCYYEWFVKWTNLGYEHATWEFENSPFLNTYEAERLVEEYETRREAARENSSASRSNKVLEIRKNQPPKLSTLPDGSPAGADIGWLYCVNTLLEYWHRSSNAVMTPDQDRIAKVILFISILVRDVCRPFLIITSSDSVLLWESELLRLMPTVNSIVYGGNKGIRKVIRDLEFYEESGCVMFKVLLSHADAIAEDFEDLACLGWEIVIVDDCQLPVVSKHLNKFKQLCAECRLLLLNGQLKDCIAEYLNILSFLDSEGSQKAASPVASESSVRATNLALVKHQFEKYCINYRKQDKSKFLEFWVPVCLSNVQLEQYCATLVSSSMVLRSQSRVDQVGAFRDILLSTRKCCDHPFLLDGSLHALLTKGLQPEEYLDVEVHASGKLRLLDKFIQEMRSKDLRVLILFQATYGETQVHIGDILDDYLRYRFGAEAYERVDAGLAMTKKQAALLKFNNKETGRFVFLLENRACLPSIKLSSVDAVVIFGSDWNPLNDIKALQRISISSQFEQIKVFRLYSISTVEEMVLLFAKKDVILESNIPNVSRSTGHSLLRWGASQLFQNLDEFHKSNSHSSICLTASCEKPLLNDTLSEILQQLSGFSGTVTNYNCLIISQVQQSGGTGYSDKVLLFGESEKPLDEDQPHLFWSRLLDGRNPQWRYSTGLSQRARRKVQHPGEQPQQAREENDEAKRKRRKLSINPADASSTQLSPRDNVQSFSTVKDNEHIVPLVDEVPKDDSEGNTELRRLQRNLYFQLKPELVELCRALQLSDDVEHAAVTALEYIMINRHVSQEPRSLLQAFKISLCWMAARSLRIKVDHKESLLLANKHLNFECDEKEAESVYLRLQMLKEQFPRTTNLEAEEHFMLPGSLENQRINAAETFACTSQGKILDILGQTSSEVCIIKSEKDDSLMDYVQMGQTVQIGNTCSKLNEDYHIQRPKAVLADSHHEPVSTSPLASGGSASLEKVNEVEFGGLLRDGAQNEHSKSFQQIVVTSPRVENVSSSIVISHLPVLPEAHSVGCTLDPRPASMSVLPSVGHGRATSFGKENAQTLIPSLAGEILPVQSAKQLVLPVNNETPEVDSDVARIQEIVDSGQSIGIMEARAADAVDSFEHNKSDASVEPRDETQYAQASAPSSLVGISPQLVNDAPLIDKENYSSTEVMDTSHGTCPLLLADQEAVTTAATTHAFDGQQQPVLDIITVSVPTSCSSSLPELPSMLPPADKHGQTDTPTPMANSQQRSHTDDASASSAEIANGVCVQIGVTSLSCADCNRIDASRESQLSEGTSVTLQNESSPTNAESIQFDPLVVEGISQSTTSVHASVPRDPGESSQQPFQIHARLPPQGLHPDPLQNELLRISKEKELVNQSCDDQKLKLRVECHLELEKVKKKYEGLIQNVEAEFAEKMKMLDMVYNKVVLNRILAEEFRTKFSENARAAAAKAASLQGFRPAVFTQQFSQISHQRFGQRMPSVASALPGTFLSPSVAPPRSPSVPSAISSPVTIPSTSHVQRSGAVLSAIPSAVPVSSLALSQRIPLIPSTIPTAVAARSRVSSMEFAATTAESISSKSMQRISSTSSTLPASISLPSVSTQRISAIPSHVPPVMSIPSVPSLINANIVSPAASGSEPKSMVSAPLQAPVPMPPLQVVNHTSALFSSNNPSRPHIVALPPPHGGSQGSSQYRSPAPHLSSFRPPASIRLPSPVLQLGNATSSQHSVISGMIQTPVSLQTIATSMPLPPSNICSSTQHMVTCSKPPASNPALPALDLTSAGPNRNVVVLPSVDQTAERNDWATSRADAFCVLSDDDI